MPTLEEAIGIFEQLSKLCETNGIHDSQELYKQYAAWLRELQDRRCEPEVTFCRSCNWNDGTCYCNFHYRNVKPYNYCSWAERRTDG